MSLFRQDDRDGLQATVKMCQDKFRSHANSRDPSLRTPFRLERLMGHVTAAQAALDEHIALHGPNGAGPEPAEFGVFMHFDGEQIQIFVDGGRPLTIDDISKHYAIVEQAE